MHPSVISTRSAVLAVLCLATAGGGAATITWSTTDGTWVDNGSVLLWSPADEPDADDIARFNTDVTVTMGSVNMIAGLSMSASSELLMNGHNLTVAGTATIGGTGTRLQATTGSTLLAENISIGSGAKLLLSGGNAAVAIDKTLDGLFSIGAGGTLEGFGMVALLDTPASPAVLLRNEGTIFPIKPPVPPPFPTSVHNPNPPATLEIRPASANARIDLDGTTEAGTVTLADNQTLDLKVTMADAFSSTLTLQRNSVFNSTSPWTLDGGNLNFINYGIGTILPYKGPSHIRGAAFTQTGGALNVVEDSEGIIEVPFTMTGGSIAIGKEGKLRFQGATSITGGSISIPSPTSLFSSLLSFEADALVGPAVPLVLGSPGNQFATLSTSAGTTVNIDGVFTNNGRVSTTGVLNFRNSASDYDGPNSIGSLDVSSGGRLSMRGVAAATFSFGGRLTASSEGEVAVTTGTFQMLQGSSLTLNGGAVRVGNSITIAGSLVSTTGSSTLDSGTGSTTIFSPTMTGSINGTVSCTGGLVIRQGAAVSGNGFLNIAAGKPLSVETTALVDVNVVNEGTLNGSARLKSYQQTDTGRFHVVINGLGAGQFNQIIVSNTATLGGKLRVARGTGYTPVSGHTFDVITANSITGSVNLIQPTNVTLDAYFHLVKGPNLLRLTVGPATPFQVWIRPFSLNLFGFDPEAAGPLTDIDGDGVPNLMEFAIDGNPKSSLPDGKIAGKILAVSGTEIMTITLPVRTGATNDPADPAGGELVLRSTADGVGYRIQASDDLVNFNLDVSQVTGPEVTAFQSTLPALTSGWSYRTFRSPGPVAGDPSEFMRVVLTE